MRPPLFKQVADLGEGLRFLNAPLTNTAKQPEDGARFVYDRLHSANSRVSPVGIEIWIFNSEGSALQFEEASYVRSLYGDIYGWSSKSWEESLSGVESADTILREKSDLFWESLAQHLAERIFGETISSVTHRFGPSCLSGIRSERCQSDGLKDAQRVVVRTYLDAGRDPMNPVTRSIVYSVERGALQYPELFFQLQVPNGVRVAGPAKEILDFRPKIAGQQNSMNTIDVWAHLPPGRRARIRNADYPDYNLLFVPLRHLVFQGDVDDPKRPASGLNYANRTALISAIDALINELRTPLGGRSVATRLETYLTPHYYYMFTTGGQGISSYKDYILGATSGIARGLSPDFGQIELVIDGQMEGQWGDPNESRPK